MRQDPQKGPIFTVSELTRQIKALLEANFDRIWVEGEVSNLRGTTPGHIYFTLKDEKSQIRVVLFRQYASLLRFEVEDGLEVLIHGNVSLYERRGEYQIIAERMEPKGLGALALAFEQLKKRLEAEGLFSPAHKKPLPLLPQRIGVVTSPTGAAIRDIVKVLDRRFSNLEVFLYPVRVQGDGAALEIAQAIKDLNSFEPRVDVIIVGRGGGSIEDLWAFNEEVVARSIFASQIPVVSAVGHEVDYTIADFVSDVRAPTPSAAAEMVVKEREELTKKIEALEKRLTQVMRHGLRAHEQRLLLALKRYGLRGPGQLLIQHQQTLDDLLEHLFTSSKRLLQYPLDKLSRLKRTLGLLSPQGRLNRERQKVDQLSNLLASRMESCLNRVQGALAPNIGKLYSLDPLAILARGYSLTYKLQEALPLTDAARVKVQDRVKVLLRKGSLLCSVEEVLGGQG